MAQAKKVKAMLAALKVGDEVSTSGGILGKITKLNDQFAILEVNANSQIKIQKQTVQAVLPKGTIKSIDKLYLLKHSNSIDNGSVGADNVILGNESHLDN